MSVMAFFIFSASLSTSLSVSSSSSSLQTPMTRSSISVAFSPINGKDHEKTSIKLGSLGAGTHAR